MQDPNNNLRIHLFLHTVQLTRSIEYAKDTFVPLPPAIEHRPVETSSPGASARNVDCTAFSPTGDRQEEYAERICTYFLPAIQRKPFHANVFP
jgi:hypothetical protein